MFKKLAANAYQISLVLATASMIGSLYFSEALGYPPCELCWYQRIALYPLVPLFIIAIMKQDKHAWYYAMPLVLFGWVVSLYQNLLYYDIIKEPIKECQAGVSCVAEYVQLFGFMDIPLMAFVALSVILLVLVLYKKYELKK